MENCKNVRGLKFSFLQDKINFLLQENTPVKGGRGHASLVMKCKLCGRENHIGKVYM